MSIDLSLDRIQTLSTLLPRYTRSTVHIAGTNGKGSVSAFVSSILKSTNPPLSVGRFNSPHLVTICDCITLNDHHVTPGVYEKTRSSIEDIAKKNALEISNFELLTLTALQIFESAQVDIVVMEVGMGGRLDATNVIPDRCIAVSALTAVDLDHQAFLGNTIAAITREKAAIARKGKPFLLGKQKHPEVMEVCREVVNQAGGVFLEAVRVDKREWDTHIDGPSPGPCSFSSSNFVAPAPQPVSIDLPCFTDTVYTRLPLYGDHQLDNLGLAASIISALVSHPTCSYLNMKGRVTQESVIQGIEQTKWPGRLSFHTVDSSGPEKLIVLADGAHNPASSMTLGRYIRDLLRGSHSKAITLTYILGLSHSPPKTPLQTLSPLLPPDAGDEDVRVKVRIAALNFSPPEGMPWVKSVPPSEIKDAVGSLCPDADLWIGQDNSRQDLPAALKWAAGVNGEHLVILAGSLYLVADFYRLLSH
ncbi:folylpolyglutamate synthase [Stygiomarasmius scandens]|uniref:Folylpolyglutamate synthase n=1 Tax=Marasmiellus scandens TaxID=2682957 RepID=A0ABR1JXN1_9AGAR